MSVLAGTGAPAGRARRALMFSGVRRAVGRSAAVRAGGGLLILIIGACVLVPVFWPDATNAFVTAPFAPPSLAHPFGSDDLGRDVFVRTLAGGRIDIAVAAAVVAISCTAGTIIGACAGSSKRRWASLTVARLVDAFIAFPYLVTILVLVVIVGPSAQIGPAPRGLTAVLIAFLVLGWTFYARLARAEAMTIRQRDYIVAAEILGYPRRKIIFRHILPGVVPVTIAYAVADAILTMGALSSFAFLGVGVQPPTPEWGAIMYEGRAYLDSAWWITVCPGLLLALTGFALSLLADGLLRGADD
ncbi:MAG TPA: ABC transporter permease [Streptosporangiaceae bacterium]